MKKVLVLAAVLFGSVAFAEKVREFGIKSGLLLNAGTKYSDLEETGMSLLFNHETKMSVGGDLGIYAHFGFGDMEKRVFSLQPELFFSFANGLKDEIYYDYKNGYYYDDVFVTYKYTSLDIALLLGCDIPVGKLSVRPYLGPKIGIPLGKIKINYEISDTKLAYKYEMMGVTIGVDFGVGLVISLGKFVLGGDIRYGIDFNNMKMQITYEEELLRRGSLGINITAGYRF